MESPNTSIHNKGFTLVEILISMGVLTLIASLGLFVSMDFYKSSSFRSEKNILLSVLQKARSQSMNNIDGQKHGVHFQTSPSVKYIIFEGTDYASRVVAEDQIIDASYGVSLSGSTDVVFDQLSGRSTDSSVAISYAGKSYTITVNSEGQIDIP